MKSLTTELDDIIARKSIVDFAGRNHRDYIAEPAHWLIGDYLNQVIEKKLKRLIITAPPQHGKSELVSVQLPALHLGRWPDDSIIMTSYSDLLLKEHSNRTRKIVSSEDYQRQFPGIELQSDTKAKQYWKIENHGGSLLATTIGGQMTGFPGKLAIIDDPIKGWKEAQSQTIRESVWNELKSSLFTRLAQDAAIVIIMTRWHQDDPVGRFIMHEREKWTILRLPAIAETPKEREVSNRICKLNDKNDPLDRKPGEALCPKRYNKDSLLGIRATIGSHMFGSLHQGAPSPPEGDRIKREWFQFVDKCPIEGVLKRIRYWDTASTPDGGKKTAGVRLAETEDYTIIEHVVTGQWSPATRNNQIKETATMDHKVFPNTQIYVEQEPGASGVEAVQSIIKLLRGFAARSDRPSGDKDTRLEPFVARSENKRVKIVRGEWNQEYIDELCMIPNGLFRDQGDATSGAYNKATGEERAESVSVDVEPSRNVWGGKSIRSF